MQNDLNPQSNTKDLFSRMLSVSTVMGAFTMSLTGALSVSVDHGLSFVIGWMVTFSVIIALGSISKAKIASTSIPENTKEYFDQNYYSDVKARDSKKNRNQNT